MPECPDCDQPGKILDHDPIFGNGPPRWDECPTCNGTGQISQVEWDAWIAESQEKMAKADPKVGPWDIDALLEAPQRPQEGDGGVDGGEG